VDHGIVPIQPQLLLAAEQHGRHSYKIYLSAAGSAAGRASGTRLRLGFRPAADGQAGGRAGNKPAGDGGGSSSRPGVAEECHVAELKSNFRCSCYELLPNT
jgi:hypothetical protein